MKNIMMLSLLLLLFSACSKDDDNVDYAAIDKEIIQEYLQQNDLPAEEHPSGLFYHIKSEGSGYKVPPGAKVLASYTGKFLDGKVFDQGRLDYYPLSRLITAWQIGIPLLKKGGEATFYCPSGLAYGSKGAGSIPPNTVLIFEIKVIDFE
ncbi:MULTISPECIES: FKBP-type peptidyl-prolyl cis-trans isomerase [unclassified Carboxylicivirga]|uniref:FKBP-type peptidyl-prolyl cis-trans isomerase n=1 Tax=Carboxylicivirga TaxID=1628153 RepID=UPI003D343D57